MYKIPLTALIVFVSATLADIIWVYYIRRTSQGRALGAATFATFIYALSAFVVIEYINNKWMLIPAALGGFVGTYFAVKMETRVKSSVAFKQAGLPKP